MIPLSYPQRLRSLIVREVEFVPDDHVAIALSAGLDSTSLVVAAREVGKRVTAFSFALAGHESRDVASARANANALGIEFVRVDLPTDVESLDRDVREIITLRMSMGLPTRKAATECSWPFIYVLHEVQRRGIGALITGSAADGNFGLSKKAMIHYRYPKAAFDDFRRTYFADDDRAQVATVREMGVDAWVNTYAPWRAASVVEALMELDWDSLNKPRQKEVVWRAFPELESLRLYRHTNLQLGDSGIADHFGILSSHYDGRSPVAVYNLIARQVAATEVHGG